MGVDKSAHLRATEGRYSVATVWRLNYIAASPQRPNFFCLSRAYVANRWTLTKNKL